MTRESLTAMLVERLFGWKARPDRFMTGDGREWLKRAAFEPTKSLDAAYRLLNAVKPIDYKLGGSSSGPCWARVRTAGGSGEATNDSMPLALCLAIAGALGLNVEDLG